MSSFVNLLDIIYPIGSIYYAYGTVTSPASTVGGTWSRIKDTFLWFTSDDAALGKTGGEKTHTLTIDEMPSHTHRATTKGSIGGSTQLNQYTDQWGASSLDSSIYLDSRVTWATGGASPTRTCPRMSSVLRGTVQPNLCGGDVACRHSSTFWISYIQLVRSTFLQTLRHQQALSGELGRQLQLILLFAQERLCQQAEATLNGSQEMKFRVPFGTLKIKERIKRVSKQVLTKAPSMALELLQPGKQIALTFVQNILLLASGTEYHNFAIGGVANV